MAFEILVEERAQFEIQNGFEFYYSINKNIAVAFLRNIGLSFNSLSFNPYFKIVKGQIRFLKVKKFPYVLFFVIDEKMQLVKVVSCFNTKRNPENRP
jgi:toxin ParE1/3/4